jgi:predicted DNA-binding ribbon-helix-helix protein
MTETLEAGKIELPLMALQTKGVTLQSRNIRIHNKRTTIRLECGMWAALNEISAIEGCSVHALCDVVYDLKEPSLSFTAALRVFLMEYYRSAARVQAQTADNQKQPRGSSMEKMVAIKLD